MSRPELASRGIASMRHEEGDLRDQGPANI
jgi:hypothetical protein